MCVFVCRVVHAQNSDIESWAQWAASAGQAASARIPREPFPLARLRPAARTLVLPSIERPLAVHAAQEHASAAELSRVLAALERAHDLLSQHGWLLPTGDGGAAADAGFDVYLEHARERAGSAAEVPLSFGALDAARVFGWLQPGLDDERLEACAVALLVDAGLLGHDPAESAGMRRATADFAALHLTGALCHGDLIDAQQQPTAGLAPELEAGAASGALLLSIVAERHDRGGGRLLRETWELARQKSEQSLRLHATPTFLQALARVLENAGDRLDDIAVELAIERYFTGERRVASPYSTLVALPDAAVVPVRQAPPYPKLPKHLPASDAPLRSFGSDYVRVDTTAADAGSQLKVWLRGELGARWALSAVRFDAAGRELGRVHAPPRRVGRAYLPIELDAHTAEVLLVVLKLPLDVARLPNAEQDAHHYQIILGT